MIPFVPDISVRELSLDDSVAIAKLLNTAMRSVRYSRVYTPLEVIQELFVEAPDAQQRSERLSRTCSGAWQAGELIGLLDTHIRKVSIDEPVIDPAENVTLPGRVVPFEENCGHISMLVLPTDTELATTVAHQMLDPIEKRWCEGGIETIRAFAEETGYAHIQAGIGILPSEWSDHFRILTSAGYQLEQRFRAMMLPLERYLEEVYPTESISLETEALEDGWICRLFHRRIYQIAHIHIGVAELSPTVIAESEGARATTHPIDYVRVARIRDLLVDSEWRGHHLGKLLLRRSINNAIHGECQQMLIYLRQDLHVGWSLLAQHGFEELDYRGYSFQKKFG